MKRGSSVRVLTLADDRYALPLAVMGRSLLENYLSSRPLLLKIIDGGLTTASRQRIERSWRSVSHSNVEWEWVAPAFGSARSLPVWGRVPALTYARLFLDAYFDRRDLEDSSGRVVLLDSDALVLGDVAELQDVELGGNAIGACIDPFIPTISALDGLPAFARGANPPDAPYFNAGVMVAELDRWQALRVGERALAYINRAWRHLRHYDQDALNVALAGQWQTLDGRWNLQPRAANALGVPLRDDARIVHFSGRLKPWLYDGNTKFDLLFRQQVARTDWRQLEVPAPWSARMWKLYDSPLRRWLHPVESRVLAWKRACGAALGGRRQVPQDYEPPLRAKAASAAGDAKSGMR